MNSGKLFGLLKAMGTQIDQLSSWKVGASSKEGYEKSFRFPEE